MYSTISGQGAIKADAGAKFDAIYSPQTTHFLGCGPDETGGMILPRQSTANRKIPAASAAHCTGVGVFGDGHGIRIQAESKLEIDWFYLLNAAENVVEIQEQVLFNFGLEFEKPKAHFFDAVMTLHTGQRIVFAIKPEVRLYSRSKVRADFITYLQHIAWHAVRSNFVDDVRLLTEADIDPIDLHNSKAIAAVRVPDPIADQAASDRIRRLPFGAGGSLRDLTRDIGLGARGYRALIRMLRTGEAKLQSGARIGPDAVIVGELDARGMDHLPRTRRTMICSDHLKAA